MTFRSLALSNIRGNLRAYSAFFMSSVFSVMIFYMYTAFAHHPDLANSRVIGVSNVRQGMLFCQCIIIMFSFLFVLYSNAAFLKSRRKEFALLTLLGMTRMQLRKLIAYENMCIAITAIGVGIGLGVLFSKPFFMALAVLLKMNAPIATAIPIQALWITAAGFFILFMLISIWTVIRVGHSGIVELLQADKKPHQEITYSPWLALLAILSLAAAYSMALLLDMKNFSVFSVFILIEAIIGTYLLFTQVSVLTLRWLTRKSKIYYRRTNMIVLSLLGHKLKGNAEMLFMVSILSAVILTASGTIYMLGLAVQLDNIKTQYADAQGLFALIMFIGIFISLLFFIASGSMIYFKLFTELQQDQEQYQALTRIGMTPSELRKIVVTQVGILFFTPCLLGIVHALFALKALNNLLLVSNWIYSFVIIGIYLAMHTIYFLVACNSYMRSIHLSKGNRI
ncbi:putative ABC transport system permease protein [Fontibacillus phaseoli]|uniref:Putative ABC transport system permease protein n=1 Tax=Fontibacillus phaseoli TaxID=1416533 RepID=A0A369BSZ7_9BACL|nr:FtsX-like permease family protein [Fontibacillus phaseoli]RCX23706.1 putative ABC transport system permease protein [Fontibacillus phaseoli]